MPRVQGMCLSTVLPQPQALGPPRHYCLCKLSPTLGGDFFGGWDYVLSHNVFPGP